MKHRQKLPIVTAQAQLGTTISTSSKNKKSYFHTRKLKNVISFVSILAVMVTFIIYTKLLRYYIPNDDDVNPSYNSTSQLYKDLSNPPKHRLTQQQCAIGILRQVGEDHQYQLFPNENCTNSILLQSPTPSSKTLTYLLLYYNDYEFLAQQLKSWNQISDSTLSQIKFVIIDDGSAIGQRAVEFIDINQNYEKSSSLDLTIYEIDQDLAWNIGGARNLGFWLSSTEWIFMSDADVLVYPETMSYIMDLTNSTQAREAEQTDTNRSPVTFGYFQRKGKYDDVNKKEPHPAVMLTKRQTYWNAQGCDEDFVGGYGKTDVHFRARGLFVFRLISNEYMSAPPLFQMSSTNTDLTNCPENMKCLSPTKEDVVAPTKDLYRNTVIYGQKKSGKLPWSDKYLRFTWRMVWQKPSIEK